MTDIMYMTEKELLNTHFSFIFKVKYVATDIVTNIDAYTSVLGHAMNNHRLLFRVPINPSTNLEESDFLDEYDSLEDTKNDKNK